MFEVLEQIEAVLQAFIQCNLHVRSFCVHTVMADLPYGNADMSSMTFLTRVLSGLSLT